MTIDNDLREKLLFVQKNEITEFYVYSYLSRVIKDKNNSEVLLKIANDELAHYNYWKKLTNKEVKPNRFKVYLYNLMARIFGITFSIKLMEKGEQKAEKFYSTIVERLPEAEKIIAEENSHENALIDMIDEEKLRYAGSIVLGLNDALIELTGALAGLTFAIQNTQIIALAGLITGIAASFSMAASNYLSEKAEGENKNYIKSAFYTGVAYIITVILLVLPYLLLSNPFIALPITIFVAIMIIFLFNYYISVAKDLSFKHRFLEMVILNLIVTAITFGIGILVREGLGIEV
ncbi:MAG: VIT1/CCC1 transporter family protein [Ignavibacteria bacterium]|nr:VIT1/CCC1 transporter family protein [Ignavibacteria bacterium]